jgi:hypothetical protein
LRRRTGLLSTSCAAPARLAHTRRPGDWRWWVGTRCMGRGEGHPKISVTYAAMDFSPSARLAATL